MKLLQGKLGRKGGKRTQSYSKTGNLLTEQTLSAMSKTDIWKGDQKLESGEGEARGQRAAGLPLARQDREL